MKLNQHPNSLILGVRDFSEDNIPLRSRFGNEMKKCDYIIVLDTDGNFKTFFSTYVDSNNLEGVFNVNNSNNGLTIVPVQ